VSVSQKTTHLVDSTFQDIHRFVDFG